MSGWTIGDQRITVLDRESDAQLHVQGRRGR